MQSISYSEKISTKNLDFDIKTEGKKQHKLSSKQLIPIPKKNPRISKRAMFGEKKSNTLQETTVKDFKSTAQIMIINDDVIQLMIIQQILSKQLKILQNCIINVTNGSQAVLKAKEVNFNIIFVDLNIPSDCFEICQ